MGTSYTMVVEHNYDRDQRAWVEIAAFELPKVYGYMENMPQVPSDELAAIPRKYRDYGELRVIVSAQSAMEIEDPDGRPDVAAFKRCLALLMPAHTLYWGHRGTRVLVFAR